LYKSQLLRQPHFLSPLLLLEHLQLLLQVLHVKSLLLLLDLLPLLLVLSPGLYFLLGSLLPTQSQHIFMLLRHQFMHIVLKFKETILWRASYGR
jgi:hypothetical protein